MKKVDRNQLRISGNPKLDISGAAGNVKFRRANSRVGLAGRDNDRLNGCIIQAQRYFALRTSF